MPGKKRTLLQDLEIFLGNERKKMETLNLTHRLFLSRYDIHKAAAQKLIDDLNGKPVTYSDRDFLTARAKKSPIHKLIVKHKNKLPPQFVQQRRMAANEHLDAVLEGREREQAYGSVRLSV